MDEEFGGPRNQFAHPPDVFDSHTTSLAIRAASLDGHPVNLVGRAMSLAARGAFLTAAPLTKLISPSRFAAL